MQTAKTLIRRAGAQSDLSLCWAHRSFCFCFFHSAALSHILEFSDLL